MGQRPADLGLHCFKKMIKDEILFGALRFKVLNMVCKIQSNLGLTYRI